MKSQDIQNKKMPDKPGVYLFLGLPKRSGGGLDVLYIGKATSLRDRVKSYFSKDLIETRGPLLVDMVFKAKKVDVVETDSVLEALILEANLIKKHQPKYNTKEKSDKSFNYVVITKEDFPRIFTMRGRELQTTHYKLQTSYGPFPHGGTLTEALNIIRKIFPFRDKRAGTKGNEVFYRQLGLAPDTSDSKAKKEYKKTIRNLKLFFEGKKKTLIKKLEKEMMTLSKKQEFEKALEIKRQIFALNHIQDIALIKDDPYTNILQNVGMRVEAYDVAHISGKSMVGVMTVVDGGVVQKNEYRKFKIRGYETSNDPGALHEVLERRLNHKDWSFPDLIVVDGGKAQLNAANRVLQKFFFGLRKEEEIQLPLSGKGSGKRSFPVEEGSEPELVEGERRKTVGFRGDDGKAQKNATEAVLKDLDLPIPVVAVVKDEYHRPKNILGDKKLIRKYEKDILLANSEAHRFSISFHRNLQRKSLKV